MQDIPVFIGGFRSGTTLLINLLGLHPQITPWFETKELCEALRWQRVLLHPEQAGFEAPYCASEPPGFNLSAVHARMLFQIRATHARLAGTSTSGKAAHERYPLGNDYVCYSQQEAEAALTVWHDAIAHAGTISTLITITATGNLIRTLGALQHALHSPGRATNAAWINKTPEISRFAPELRTALGRCQIIYVVRDGIDVVASGLRLGWGSVEALAFNWKGLLERSRAAMQGHEADYLELRYEQLVLEPEATLERVLRFCGRMEQAAELVRLFSAQQGASASSPFDTSRMQGSKSLDAAQLRVFTAVAGDMQAALGYPSASAALRRDKARE